MSIPITGTESYTIKENSTLCIQTIQYSVIHSSIQYTVAQLLFFHIFVSIKLVNFFFLNRRN